MVTRKKQTIQDDAGILERGPDGGYGFPEKQQYREEVWCMFAKNVSDVATAKVLFLPGKEGMEIPIAMALGFREENLIACDENPALIATAPWRKKYPHVRCYGTTLERTAQRLRAEKVTLNAANLDFCANLCESVYTTISSLFEAGVTSTNFVLAVTLLKGREPAMMTDTVRAMLNLPAVIPIDRVSILRMFLTQRDLCTLGLTKSEYRSGVQRMVFGVWVVNPTHWLVNQWSEVVQKQQPAIAQVLELQAKMAAEKSIDKMQEIKTEQVSIGRRVYSTIKEYRDSVCLWHARSDIMDQVEGWRECLRAIEHVWYWVASSSRLYRKDQAEEVAKELEAASAAELTKLRERMRRSEAEKSQLLQAGRAYR